MLDSIAEVFVEHVALQDAGAELTAPTIFLDV